MSPHKKTAVIVAAALALLPVLATFAANTSVKMLRQKYEDRISGIEDDYLVKMDVLPRNYSKSLEVLKRTTQDKGDLDGFQAIGSEIKRFDKAQDVKSGDLNFESDALRDVQVKYMGFVLDYEIDKNKKIVELTEQYVKTLADLEKGYTRKNRIDDALKMRKEADRVKGTDVLSKAEFDLEDSRERQKEVEGLSESGGDADEHDNNPSEDPDDDPVEAEEWDKVGGPGVKIFREGKEPVGLISKYRRVTPLTKTGKAPPKSVIYAEVMTGKVITYNREKDRRFEVSQFGNERSVFKKEQCKMRLVLGSRVIGHDVKRPTVVIDYFTKDSKGKEDFEKRKTEIIKVPNLVPGKKKVIVHTKGIFTESGKMIHGRSRYSLRLYGVVVTVFDGDEKIVYQVVSPSALKGEAPSSIPSVSRNHRGNEQGQVLIQAPNNQNGNRNNNRNQGRRTEPDDNEAGGRVSPEELDDLLDNIKDDREEAEAW